MFRTEQNRTCYMTCVMLCYMTYVQDRTEQIRTCYITCVMLCYSGAPRAKRACGAPWVNKSTHPRKFGNHVTDRPSDRPSAPQAYQCLLSAVKTGYPLTSITWPYRELRCRPIEVEYSLNLSADNLLFFK